MQHIFTAEIKWLKKSDEELKSNRRMFKNHFLSIEGKDILTLSAAKHFKGDSSLYNPEDLLLASITSCHMMSYLYCCEVENISVLQYQDQSEAILKVNPDGSGKIEKVILRPHVILNDDNDKIRAMQLHTKANELCFIANSCNFQIIHLPIIKFKNEK